VKRPHPAQAEFTASRLPSLSSGKVFRKAKKGGPDRDRLFVGFRVD